MFLFPLILSIVAAIMAFMAEECGWIARSIVTTVVVVAALMQFVPALQENVHFLVPLFMQLAVCGWWYFAVLNPPP